MTQPDSGSGGYVPRKYESEVYAKVAEANGNKTAWSPDYHDPADVAGKYSAKSGELYERTLAAEKGGYRAGLDASDVLYQSMPHERMASIVHDGASAQAVDEQGLIINKLGNAFKEMSTTLRQAVTKEQAGWQGAGADAAFNYLGGLATWSDSAGDAAFLTANRYSQTSAAIASAQHSMPEPAGRTVAQSMDLARQQFQGGNFADGLATMHDSQNQAAIQFQAQQQAAAVLTARDQTLYGTGSTQPMYTAPPQPVALTAAAGTVAGPAVGGGAGSAVNRTSAASAGVSSGPVAGAGPGQGAGPVSTIPVQGGSTTGVSPPTAGAGPGLGTGGGWSGRTPGPGLDVGLVPPPGGGPGGDVERGGSSRGRGGAGGSGRVGGGATEQGPGAGKRSGVAEPGAKAASEAAARSGTAGKAGRPGASGMPGAATGKKSEDDKEHKRPAYVVDGDPKETYGFNIETDDNGNKIAPPVLGT